MATQWGSDLHTKTGSLGHVEDQGTAPGPERPGARRPCSRRARILPHKPRAVDIEGRDETVQWEGEITGALPHEGETLDEVLIVGIVPVMIDRCHEITRRVQVLSMVPCRGTRPCLAATWTRPTNDAHFQPAIYESGCMVKPCWSSAAKPFATIWCAPSSCSTCKWAYSGAMV